ncbi:hypothetical protein N7507_004243 [Penicillium longicatenatum]|nr:hypothetical protein N7507_004243 [Penicillium longicatenatum]
MTHQVYNVKWEWDGTKLQDQMENAQDPGCTIARSTLTLDDLDSKVWRINWFNECIPSEFLGSIEELELPEDTVDDETSPYQHVSIVKREFPPMSWIGRVGKGIIILEAIVRAEGNTCYISDLTKAAYEEFFPLDTLRYVIAGCVESSTAEFKSLVGCGVGKCVASFILAAYGQGVKRIARVITWYIGLELEMMFCIEDVA